MSADHAHASHGTHRSKLTIVVGITAAILVAEVIGAWWTNSLALLVDAGYMLTPASGLLMALIAVTAGIVIGAAGARLLDAQQAGGITRVMLLRTDLQGVEGREAVLGTAEVAPGMAAAAPKCVMASEVARPEFCMPTSMEMALTLAMSMCRALATAKPSA